MSRSGWSSSFKHFLKFNILFFSGVFFLLRKILAIFSSFLSLHSFLFLWILFPWSILLSVDNFHEFECRWNIIRLLCQFLLPVEKIQTICLLGKMALRGSKYLLKKDNIHDDDNNDNDKDDNNNVRRHLNEACPGGGVNLWRRCTPFYGYGYGRQQQRQRRQQRRWQQRRLQRWWQRRSQISPSRKTQRPKTAKSTGNSIRSSESN